MKKFALAAILICLISSRAFAAGMTAHMYVADEAINRVSDPKLKYLLQPQRDAVLAGSVFPDTGNGLRFAGWPAADNYDEPAHWPPFMEAYLAHIKDNCSQPYDDHCRLMVAHFMGVAAHLLEDGTFHETFDWYVAKMDHSKADLDIEGDMILIEKYHRGKVIPKYRVLAEDLAEIFHSMGLDFTKNEIKAGNRAHRAGLVLERALAPFKYESNKKKLPWMMANMYSGPGGVDFSADVLAKYWDDLWLRLNGKDDQVQQVVGTFPKSNGAIPVDAEIYVMFGMPMQILTLNNSSFLLRDAEGQKVQGKVRNHSQGFSSLNIFSAFIPQSPLKSGEIYTMTLTREIKDLNGKPLSPEYSWTFTTVPDK